MSSTKLTEKTFGAITSTNPVGAMLNEVNHLVDTINDYAKFAEQEETKRTEIVNAAKVQINQIREQANIIKENLQLEYRDRFVQFQEHFKLLNKILDKKNITASDLEIMHSSLQSITKLSSQSATSKILSAYRSKDIDCIEI